MTDQIQSCQRALDAALEMIESAPPATLAKPTPCENWDARALIDHMIDTVRTFGSGFGAKAAASQTGDDPAASYKQAADALMAAIRQPGALDKTLKFPFGEMPGNQAINIVIGDQAIHTWDLAKALGKPFTMDEDLATSILAMLHQILTPERRGPGKGFSEAVSCPESAPVQDRLLAFSGRQP